MHTYIATSIKLAALMEVLHIICNMNTCDLFKMYACNPQATPLNFEYFKQITRAHVKTTIMHYFSLVVEYN